MVALVAIVTLFTASPAWAAELDELLERSREASYSAEQFITCQTPDGTRDAVVRIVQSEGEIRIGSSTGEYLEVSAGFGDWTLSVEGGVVSAVSLAAAGDHVTPDYQVEDGIPISFLGRDATAYSLTKDGVLRAELVFDDELGALVQATSYSTDGTPYCDRRFISLQPAPSAAPTTEALDLELVTPIEVDESELPESVAGFERLDFYRDDTGVTFAYYSDGLFSFAVFETPYPVELPDAVKVEAGEAAYLRSFTPGQVTLVWETRDGGMALLGDAPPDLIDAVLAELPQPYDQGLLRRLWNRIFG